MPDPLSAFGVSKQAQPSQPQASSGALSAFGVSQKQKKAPQPAASPAQTTLPEQQPLPEGAKGFDPNGQPFFGDGIPGILKKWKWNLTKDVKDVDEADWDDLKARWSASRSKTGLTAQENDQEALAQLGMMSEAIGKGYQDIVHNSQGSVLAPVLKATGASVTALGELFSLGAQKFEQFGGAFEDSAYAVNDILTGNYDTEAWEQYVRAQKLDNTSKATDLALSPSENKWEYLKMKTDEGWQSGRILYSQVLDSTLKEQYLQRYRAGEDPALLAMELQNPLAEMAGQLIFDPLNVVGAFGKAAKAAKELNVVHDSLTASNLYKLEKGQEALRAMDAAQTEQDAIRALHTLTEARMEANAIALKKSKLLNVGYGINDLTTSSRQGAVINKGKELLGNMALTLKESGMSYDAVAEAMLYGAKSVSDNADEVQEGLAWLRNLPNANMWLSDDYAETFTVVRKLLTDDAGVLNGKKLSNLMKVSNPAEFADEATKIMAAAAHQEFPSVSELAEAAELARKAAKGAGEISPRTLEMAQAYEKLPNHVKQLNQIDQTLSKYIKNPINNFLSPFYFNYQGGVAVKNILSNFELVAIDKGPGAWFKDGKYWSAENIQNFLTDAFGAMPASAGGFDTLVQSQTGQKAKAFGKLMEWGEQQGALRVVGASVRDTFKSMIPKAMPSLAKEVEAGVLTQRQADHLAKLLLKNNGNVPRTIEQFREIYKLGAVESWRNLDFVTDFQRDALESLGYWDEIEELATRGANSADEVEEIFAKIQKSIDSRSELATGDVIGLSSDHPAAESWGDLMKAVDDGLLNPGDQQVFTAIMESAEQARLEYQTLLDNVALKAQMELSQASRLEEAQHIGQEMNRVRETLRKAGPATARETHKITQDAWRWSDLIKKEKAPTAETLQALWKKAGLAGDPPLDLTKPALLKELWKQRFEKVTKTWNESFDAIFGESETILKQMEGVVDVDELNQMAARTRQISQQAQTYRAAVFDGKALRVKTPNDVFRMAKRYGVASASQTGQPLNTHIVNTVNKYLELDDAKKFKKLEEIPIETMREAFEKRRQVKGLPEVVEDAGVAIPPPHPIGAQPSLPRVWNESAKGAKQTLEQIKAQILQRWGQTDDARQYSSEMEEVLGRVAKEVAPKMNEIKAVALRVAEQQREFTLLNYGKKTYGDIMLSYVMPYHFFYTRSYKNWLRRIATNPEILAGYGKYKNAMEDINKDLPDWYKQQIDVTKMLGIKTDHPLYFNLESAFNPLYGLTGTDFQDPAKRTNWATATFDDMGKFGPTIWAPIQMAIAAKLYHDGETDAASRWGSRLIPQTSQIKAVTSLFGKPVELDPAVNFFSGGIDPYERGRMGYAAAQLIESGAYTAEEVQEQFQAQEGPAWDEAYQLAIQSRAASSISSYFLGVGFKPRSTNDVMVEKMYTQLNKLYAMKDTMTPEEFRTAQDQLRAEFPDGLVDTVLLAKKGGDQRDAAYAYNVLGRLPPGEMSEVFKAIGISQKDISKFYDSKGFTAAQDKDGNPLTWTKTEKERFMSAVVDLGAMLKIPDDATRAEWNEARNAYSSVYKDIEEQLGSDIWDKVSHYYDLKDDNKQAADQFKQAHPEVIMALQMKGEAVANIPVLSAYYGGIDNIEAYLSGQVRQQLENKYGPDIYDIQTGYFNATNQRSYLAQHPELRRFWKEKKALDAEMEKKFMEFGMKLPDPKGAQFREGFSPSSGVQETLYDALQPQGQIPQWEEVSQGMAPWLQTEVKAYWQNGKKLSKRAETQLDYLAQQQGFYNAKDLLRTVGLSLQQTTQMQASPFGVGP